MDELFFADRLGAREVVTSGRRMPDSTLRITYDFTTPITVGPGSSPQTLNITIDVNQVLQYYPAGEVAANPVIGPGSPSVTID